MKTDTTQLETRITKATNEIAHRYGVSPDALRWEPNPDGSTCSFRSSRGEEYLAMVTAAGKNVLSIFGFSKQVHLC